LLAFIFDLILFYVAKARINSIGSAQIGSAIWLTLAAWVLLFFSGCFYTLGRCCISNRQTKNDWRDTEMEPAEQSRLDAVKQEADRKAHQKPILPLFQSRDEYRPLTGAEHGNYVDVFDPMAGDQTVGRYDPTPVSPAENQAYPAGYVPATPGTSAIDDYYSRTTPTYPPPPQQASGLSPYNYNPTASPPSLRMPVPLSPHELSHLATSGNEYYNPYGEVNPPPDPVAPTNPYPIHPQQSPDYRAVAPPQYYWTGNL